VGADEGSGDEGASPDTEGAHGDRTGLEVEDSGVVGGEVPADEGAEWWVAVLVVIEDATGDALALVIGVDGEVGAAVEGEGVPSDRAV
jgi:hypothetical protein